MKDATNNQKEMNQPELLSRYLYAVGRELPEKGREDILKELESDILERLEGDDAQHETAVLESILMEFGAPERIGARYGSRPQHLIGPELFPIWKQVLRVVLVVMMILLSAVYLISMIFNPENITSYGMFITEWLGSLIQVAFTFFAIITIGFAIADRHLGDRIPMPEETFDPGALDPVPQKQDRVHPAEEVLNIITNIVILFFLILRPLQSGLFVRAADGGRTILVPTLDENIFSAFFWPAILLLILSTIFSAMKLIRKQYTAPLHLMDGIMCFAWAAFVLIVLNQSGLIPLPAEAIAAMDPDVADGLGVALGLSLRITSFAIAIPCAISGVRHLLSARRMNAT